MIAPPPFLREICEETGLLEQDIRELRLQYILIRLNQGEVRQQFIYTAQTAAATFTKRRRASRTGFPASRF
ncbi:hypothetical protein [Paenibacillus sophorae]|nr:hypothetical protein [Paenibacillus sophorae]